MRTAEFLEGQWLKDCFAEFFQRPIQFTSKFSSTIKNLKSFKNRIPIQLVDLCGPHPQERAGVVLGGSLSAANVLFLIQIFSI